MGASSVVRIPRLSLLLLIGMAGASREAVAEPPACFPERTVMISAQVYDEQGHVFAGLRAGHRVRIIDDFVGKDFDRALVEIDEPVRIRGFVNRVLLHAFPRRQLEVMAGKRWWISGVALNLHQGDSKTALATRAELHDPVLSDGTSRILLPGVTVACADLEGAPPTITARHDCYGAVWSSPDQPQGRSMRWRTEGGVLGRIEEADSELFSQVTPHPGQSNVDYYLIRRAGKRALIDIWDWSGERTRTWVPSELFRDGRPSARRTFTEKCQCCPARVSLPISANSPRVRLRSEAQVRLAPDGAPVATLERGRSFPLLARLDQQALVLVENRSQPISTSLLYTWVEWASLDGPPELPLGFRGTVVPFKGPLAGSAVPKQAGVRIDIRPNPFEIRGRLVSDTEFWLPWSALPGWRTPYVEAEDGFPLCSPQGDAQFYALKEDAGPLRCGVGARAYHSVRVTTRDGLGIPNALVAGTFGPKNEWSGRPVQVIRSGSDGRVRIPWVENGNGGLVALASGFHKGPVFNPQAGEQVVNLSLQRERVVAGSVARDAEGLCDLPMAMGDNLATYSGGWQGCRFSLSTTDGVKKFRWNGELVTIPPGDVLNLCLGKTCGNSPRHAWLFVRVATDKEALVASARISASINGTEVGRCLAPAGACFIHDIPAEQEVLLEAMTPEGNGQAITNPRPDAVTEITVPLP